VLGWEPVERDDVERHTGERPVYPAKIWRIEVSGRFLRAGGLVYPGGVPFPEDLQHQTAVVSSEVWLYVDEDTERLLGVYSWPEAVRRPIASAPRPDFDAELVCHVADARFDFPLRVPAHPDWDAALVVCVSSHEAVVLCVRDTMPDPLNEMLLYEQGGLVLHAKATADRPDVEGILRRHQPPFRRVGVGRAEGAGREPGRSLGPQTWPWPGELLWFSDGVSYELKGFEALDKLREVAATLEVISGGTSPP
jgi:hypothetical protein